MYLLTALVAAAAAFLGAFFIKFFCRRLYNFKTGYWISYYIYFLVIYVNILLYLHVPDILKYFVAATFLGILVGGFVLGFLRDQEDDTELGFLKGLVVFSFVRSIDLIIRGIIYGISFLIFRP
jgi:hypothetical protein